MLFCCLRRNVDLRLLVINTSPSSPTNNKRRRLLLPAISVRNLPRSGAAMCITLGGRTVDNKRTWWSQILVENLDFTYPTCIWRPVRGSLSECTMFGTEKLEWCGYPTVKQVLTIRLFVSTDLHHERDGRIDGQTDEQTDTASHLATVFTARCCN